MVETAANTAVQEAAEQQTTEKLFTQAELDAVVSREKNRAVKKATQGMPNEEELAAFRTWQESQKTEQDRLSALAKERDESKAALAAAETELEQLRRERYVLSKGYSGEEAEFIAFKAGKAVDDKTSFEQAVDALTAENAKKASVDFTAPVGVGNSQSLSLNERINRELRGQ